MLKTTLLTMGLSTAFMASSHARTIVNTVNKAVYNHDQNNCTLTESCGLKKLSLLVEDYTSTIHGEHSYGTRAYISFDTQTVGELTDYAIVQRIKGCAFHSELNREGHVEKHYGVAREFFGHYKTFIHRQWVIDSIDEDPMYNNYSDPNRRHAYHRWSDKPGQFKNDDQQHYFFKDTPKYPQLYVTDRPSLAMVDKMGKAKNVSLKFKTCIYKTSDIPLVSVPEDIHFSEPLGCLEWDSSFIYNHKRKKFEHSDSIDPFCE